MCHNADGPLVNLMSVNSGHMNFLGSVAFITLFLMIVKDYSWARGMEMQENM
jgi:hypothetical protein